jgi:DNA-binding MarR family transcriptional regulator
MDTPWDLIVSIYCAELERRKLPASELYAMVGGAPTTAIRWTVRLIEEGLVRKFSDPTDRRKIYLQLTDSGSASMQAYLAAIGESVPI